MSNDALEKALTDAFDLGMHRAVEAIGPKIATRAMWRALPIGFFIGLCTGGALVHYLG